MKERKKKKNNKRKRQRETRRTFSLLSLLSWLSVFGYSVRRCDGLPVVGVPAVVLVFFPSLLFPFIIFYFLAFTLSGRFRYLRQAFPFWRSFGRRLLLLAVMVLFYPSEYKKPLQSVNG